ncbi:hypothetical protein [Halomonas sp. YLGW01]|uniref:hypothetical protein n=1 Tax=Halomonas sp. YLGW01 TaxID=2773308 RepID=UPI00177E751B|nr:hypothetical protein [Halomonas sp. YLGW01]
MLYIGGFVAALVVFLLLLKAFGSGKGFMKAALYHYYMDGREGIIETHGPDAAVPDIAYRMAARTYQNMNNSQQDSSFCFEVLNYQVRNYGGRKAMLQAARQRHFPE